MRQAFTIERSWWQQRRHGALWRIVTRAVRTARGWTLHAIAERYGAEPGTGGRVHRDLYDVSAEDGVEYGEPRARVRALLLSVLLIVRTYERERRAPSPVGGS